jgi:TRAP-type uncharacterized transport system substrate-binding protein
MRTLCVVATALACLVATFDATSAQTNAKQREQYRERLNENVVYLMGGQIGAALVVVAHDISVVVNDGDNLRVLPVLGGGAAQNLRDVVFLRGIDLGITTLLTLNHAKASGEFGPNLDQQVSYITALFPEIVQVLARPENNRIEDLRGKKVSFNTRGSSTALFAPVVFKTLGIEVQEFTMPQGDAVEKMRNGEIDATVCTCPVPLPGFSAAKAEYGFKLIPVPYAPALEENYHPAKVMPEDYPNLLAKHSAGIDTIGSSIVLISFNWPRNTARYTRVAKFVDAMFTKFDDLQKPPRHPNWKSVNLAAKVRGWQRFPAAQEWIDRSEKAEKAETAALRTSFERFVASKRAATEKDSTAAQERLFKEFMDWARVNRR